MLHYLDGPAPPGPFHDVWCNHDLVERIVDSLPNDVDVSNFRRFMRSLRRTPPLTPSSYAIFLARDYQWLVFQSYHAILRFLHADETMQPFLSRLEDVGTTSSNFAYALSYRLGPLNVVRGFMALLEWADARNPYAHLLAMDHWTQAVAIRTVVQDIVEARRRKRGVRDYQRAAPTKEQKATEYHIFECSATIVDVANAGWSVQHADPAELALWFGAACAVKLCVYDDCDEHDAPSKLRFEDAMDRLYTHLRAGTMSRLLNRRIRNDPYGDLSLEELVVKKMGFFGDIREAYTILVEG